MATTEVPFGFQLEEWVAGVGEPTAVLHGLHSATAERSIEGNTSDLVWRVQFQGTIPPYTWIDGGVLTFQGRITWEIGSGQFVISQNVFQLGTPWQVIVNMRPQGAGHSDPRARYYVPPGPNAGIAGGGGFTRLEATRYAFFQNSGATFADTPSAGDDLPSGQANSSGMLVTELEPTQTLRLGGGQNEGVPSAPLRIDTNDGMLTWPLDGIAHLGWHSDASPWDLEIGVYYEDVSVAVVGGPAGNPKPRDLRLSVIPEIHATVWRDQDARSARVANWHRGYPSGMALPLSPREQPIVTGRS